MPDHFLCQVIGQWTLRPVFLMYMYVQ